MVTRQGDVEGRERQKPLRGTISGERDIEQQAASPRMQKVTAHRRTGRLGKDLHHNPDLQRPTRDSREEGITSDHRASGGADSKNRENVTPGVIPNNLIVLLGKKKK